MNTGWVYSTYRVNLCVFLAAGWSLLVPEAAYARTEESPPADIEIVSNSAFQAYEVRNPVSGAVLSRRRFSTTLSLDTFRLFEGERQRLPVRVGGAPTEGVRAEYTFRTRLRYDGDAGIGDGEITPSRAELLVPGLVQSRFDIPYAYLEGRNLLGGRLTFRLGRRYRVDENGFWSIDGLAARVSPRKVPVAFDAVVGSEVRGGLPLSSPRFEAQGAYRGSRTGFDSALQPGYAQSAFAPAVGVGAEGTVARRIHVAVHYRRVWNTGSSATDLYGDSACCGSQTYPTVSGLRVSRIAASAALSADFGRGVNGRSAIVWDAHFSRVRSGYVSLQWMPTTKATLAVDYDYLRPTFDADTIWNFFAAGATSDLGLRSDLALDRTLTVGGGARIRAFGSEDHASSAPSGIAGLQRGRAESWMGATYATSGDLHAKYTHHGYRVGARVEGAVATNASRMGTDIYVEKLWDDRFVTGLRGSLWRWHDAARAGRDALSVGWVGSLGYRFDPRTEGRMEVEHNVNRLYGGRFRLLFVLTVAVSR